MDNLELRNSLKEQKVPFDEAVKKKLEYLKSDEVFSIEDDQYIASMKNLIPAQQDTDPLMAAFGGTSAPSNNSFASSPASGMPQRPMSSAPTGTTPAQAAPAPTQNRQMTMAERIAALRGALYVPQEFQK